MDIAEKLYQRGYLSYPRTETDKFKEGFDLQVRAEVRDRVRAEAGVKVRDRVRARGSSWGATQPPSRSPSP